MPSLVGSEMCIRDSPPPLQEERGAVPLVAAVRADGRYCLRRWEACRKPRRKAELYRCRGRVGERPGRGEARPGTSVAWPPFGLGCSKLSSPTVFLSSSNACKRKEKRKSDEKKSDEPRVRAPLSTSFKRLKVQALRQARRMIFPRCLSCQGGGVPVFQDVINSKRC